MQAIANRAAQREKSEQARARAIVRFNGLLFYGLGSASFLESAAPLQAQVLKVGHHGSRYATSAGFLEAVAPEAAVISSGADNRYGHPARQTLDRLKKAGVKIYRTDLNGEIAIISDGNKFEIHVARQPVQVALLSGFRFQVSGFSKGVISQIPI